MKSPLRSLLLSLLILPAAVHADTTAPMFASGNTLTIHGEVFTWTGPATEDATWHYDTYTNATSQTVTVTGMLGRPDVATVSGTSSAGAVDGYLSAGVYGDSQIDLSEDASWQINGVTYTHHHKQGSYSVGFTDDVTYLAYTGFDDYSGPNGSLHRWWLGDESHSTFSGGTTPFCGQQSFTVFGNIFTYNPAQSTSYTDDYGGSIDAGWTDYYTGSGDSTLQVISTSTYGTPHYQLKVWDPHLGSMTSNAVSTVPSSSLTGITWIARTAPTFARPQLWFDGKLLNWQSGSITTAGLVADTYGGAGVTLTVSALAQDYFVTHGNAAVTITSAGGGTGALGQDGTFTLSGHVLQNAEPNHSAPLFTGTATLISVNYSDYAFAGGFQDSLGNRADTYVNPGYGTLTLLGTTADTHHATVKLYRSGLNYSGTYSNGTFSVSQNDIFKEDDQPSIYGPPAFWVRGELYQQNPTTPTSYTSAAPNNHSLTLTGSSTWTLAGTDATGAFSGTCSKDPVGVFLVQALDQAGQPISGVMVPVVAANADGTLHLSWSAAPTGMPPALLMSNHTFVYLGTATEDTHTATTAAYYGSSVLSDQTPWLFKLRTDGSTTTPYTATHTNYSTATSTTGIYSSQTHLFQTSTPASGFPLPIYGVDPNANYAYWGLLQPASTTGLPATFIVNGDVWRYTGTNQTTGVSTYLGYYTTLEGISQQMTVTAPDPATGLHVVTVTDPVQGTGSPITGTLSNVRGSARLSDGSVVYSGQYNGQRLDFTPLGNNLQSFDADLDITGSVFSFGALIDNAAMAGAALQFQDVTIAGSLTASLSSILARPLAQWQWSRAAATSGLPPLPVMKLDASSKLTLYDRTSGNAGVVLDPTPGGISTINGVLRVRPGGDIDMDDDFKTSPPGMTAP
ncbi:hypothetical protein [Prosthecobacter sp.]|uniref:hypothetical protein n=1 Tax=Prosthecobacter sp. TaxID=1965333 RepID=UPI003783732F